MATDPRYRGPGDGWQYGRRSIEVSKEKDPGSGPSPFFRVPAPAGTSVKENPVKDRKDTTQETKKSLVDIWLHGFSRINVGQAPRSTDYGVRF